MTPVANRLVGECGSTRRSYAVYDSALVVVAVALAMARLLGQHGYGVYKPIGMQLLEGWPTSWEVFYFLDHVPTFLADAPSRLGIAPVDYRTYINLYLFTQLYGWTGSAYWSLALVDLGMWIIAAVCVLRVGLRLGLSRAGAFGAALLTTACPIFAGQMWHQDLHLANFASLPIGLWACVVLIQEHRSRVGLTCGLAFVLLYLSLTYQYQWFVAPVAFVLMVFQPAVRVRAVALITTGALALFAGATWILQAVLVFSGLGPTPARLEAVQQPFVLVTEQVAQVTDVSSLLTQLPGVAHVLTTATVYHPIIYVAGLIGLAQLGSRGAVLGLVAVVFPLLFLRLYPTPWVAMTAYPLIYLGAGNVCGVLGRLAPRVLREGVAVAAAIGLTALANGDLWGDTRFLLGWWNVYSPVPIH